MKKLSLAMIVKNEARCLARCLRSVQKIANEIIIVDTGSTDRTGEIANEHGTKVFHFDWCDDFSAARNFALAQTPATGFWFWMRTRLSASRSRPRSNNSFPARRRSAG